LGKNLKAGFTSERKEENLSGSGKAVEKDPTWSWHLVGNSNFFNGDVGIMRLVILNFGKQITVSSSLVCLSCCSLVHIHGPAFYIVVCLLVK
jgi:hypothetical protein